MPHTLPESYLNLVYPTVSLGWQVLLACPVKCWKAEVHLACFSSCRRTLRSGAEIQQYFMLVSETITDSCVSLPNTHLLWNFPWLQSCKHLLGSKSCGASWVFIFESLHRIWLLCVKISALLYTLLNFSPNFGSNIFILKCLLAFLLLSIRKGQAVAKSVCTH